MTATAAHLALKVFPDVAVRQWVLSLPYELRGMLAAKAPVLSCVLRLFLRMVTAWYQRTAKQAGLAGAKTGAVAFPQRFGGSLNLNVHFHVVFLDGVFAKNTAGKLAFHPLQPPSQTEIATLVADIGRRVKNLLRRRGLLRNNPLMPKTAPAAPGGNEGLPPLRSRWSLPRALMGVGRTASAVPGAPNATGSACMQACECSKAMRSDARDCFRIVRVRR